MTKEPKLDRAMRIAPEWKEYDSKLKKILEQADNNSEYLNWPWKILSFNFSNVS